MGAIKGSNDLFPPNTFPMPESTKHFSTTGPLDSEPSAASSALNVAVHLLQKYSSPSTSNSVSASAKLTSPLGSLGISVRPAMASSSTDSRTLRRRKLCFVTVGATAPFDILVQAVQAPPFLSALETYGFTNLLIQHGHQGETTPSKDVGAVRISSFDFRKDGIQREITGAKGDMRKTKAELKGGKTTLEGLDFGSEWQDATWEEGVVISHAGSGSILDALRVSVPLIVVPNSGLLDNHQVDLARELAKQGYVLHGNVEKLSQALADLEELKKNRKQWPPPSDPTDKGGRGLIGIMDEEMGYRDLKNHNKVSRLYLD